MFNPCTRINPKQKVLLIGQFRQLVDNHNASENDRPDNRVIVKFFNPVGSETWYFSELDPETGIAYGYVTGMQVDEFGYTDLNELISMKGRLHFGMSIERDTQFSTDKSLCDFVETQKGTS